MRGEISEPVTTSLFSLSDLRERRHSHWQRRLMGDGDYSMVETDESVEILAVIDALEVATDLLRAEGYDTDPDYRREWATVTGQAMDV